ncbi:MAG: DUF971 domain-containing protein [Planctomycetes bacterium]|nr:DUF971 domain-containing protein [Planctomycetota bacterium]
MNTLIGLRRGGEDIVLKWQDGTEGRLRPRDLRIACPCAFCVSEVTGERLLDPTTVPEDLSVVDMQPVGNYAYRLLFSDGHDSGIYRLELLHAMCRHPPGGIPS